MHLLVVGLSHHTAPVELREQLAFHSCDADSPLRALMSLPSVAEGLILSTCNRVELYAVSHDPVEAGRQLRELLSAQRRDGAPLLDPHLYELADAAAIRHLFRVASSLDSMVLGEPQILGQLKTAYAAANACGCAGPILHRLLPRAFATAKRVRSETAIAQHAVSVSYAAVELARRIFGDLAGRTVMIIGAGKMCELAARHLVTQQVGTTLVTNRTLERARQLAAQIGGQAVAFDQFPDHLHQADIVLTSTAAGGVLLTCEQLEQVIRKRRNRAMFLIDIAVPRNIDPAANRIDNLYLYDIDDLQGVIAANLQQRRKAADKAEDIVDQEVERFSQWLRTLEVKPLIVALHRQVEELRRQELARTLAGLGHLSAPDRQAIEAMSRALINKVLHQPITVIKAMGHEKAGELYLETARRLFRLEPEAGSGLADTRDKEDGAP